MAKRNLNEVLGFISRWGDSRFSSRLMESEASPKEEMDGLDKRIRQVQDALKTSGGDPDIKAELDKLNKEHKLKKIDYDDRMMDWDNKKTAADKRDADEEAVENALNASPEPPPKRSFFGKLFGKLKDTITAKDELSGGITGEEEKPSFKSRMLGKISDVAGRAGETAGMIGAISGIGTTLGQGMIQMNRAQTGKRDVMGASVGGFTKTVSGIGSGLDRLSVGADRLEDEQQIKQATQKIEAQMKNLRKFQSDANATEEQKKIAAERYRKLEQARQDARSKNRFNAARMQRMLDLLGTGRTTPTPPTPKP